MGLDKTPQQLASPSARFSSVSCLRSPTLPTPRRRHSYIYSPASAMEDPVQGGPPQSLVKVTVSPEGISKSEARTPHASHVAADAWLRR